MQPAHLARWHQLTLAEKLGNIGSEISRAHSWQRRGDQDQIKRSLERAVTLLDQSLDNQRLTATRELLRFREVLSAMSNGSNAYTVSLEMLQRYCLAFAISSRQGKA